MMNFTKNGDGPPRSNGVIDQKKDQSKMKAVEEEQQQNEVIKKRKDETIRTLDIYGLKSFMDAKSKSAKIFWLVLLIVCTAIFVQQLYKTITNYINSPIVSTYTIVTKDSMEFPIVYICPTSFVSSVYLNKTPTAERDAIALKEEMGVIWDYVDFFATGNLTGTLPVDSSLDASDTSHVDPSALKALRRRSNRTDTDGPSLESDQDAEEFFKVATVDLDNNVRYCEFRSFSFEKLPCQNITKEVLDPEHGKCYVIDVNGRQQSVQSQAMILTFNVRSLWYPKTPELAPQFNGVYLSIQRKFNVDKSGESILLTPGTYYRVDLAAQHQIFESFQHPYQQVCVQNDSYPKFEIYKVNYTQQSCLYDCAARSMRDACGCVPPADSSLHADGVLASTNGFCKRRDETCLRKIAENASAVERLTTCRAQCQRPCEDWRYSIRATSMDLFKYGFDAGIPIHDLLYILVSFSQMEYTEFKQDDSKTADQMIADIGGEAGLWLGAGMLTLIQMPLFAVAVCGGCCKKKLKKTKTGDAENAN